MLTSVYTKFKPLIEEMIANSQKQHVVTDENVYQEGNKANLKIFNRIVESLMLPGSGVNHVENLIDLYRRAQEGKSCLILMEHYSNFDLPCFCQLLAKSHPEGPAAVENLVAIAGMKLNEESPLVLAFAEAFSRIIIYPSRTLASIADETLLESETRKSKAINLAAMKALAQAKASGKLILVFPAGTRYRPGRPETKKGVKEIDSYLKGFDCMVLVSINGNTLEVTKTEDMKEEMCREDVILYTVSPVLSCDEFRKTAQGELPEGEDPKQYTVDKVMAILEEMHETYEKERQKFL